MRITSCTIFACCVLVALEPSGAAPARAQNRQNPTDAAPSITSAASVTFTVGSPKTFLVTTSGDPTPALNESGPLPSGVSFTDNNDGTATLAGTAASGSDPSYGITITATNGVAPDAMQSFTLEINQPPDAQPDLLGTFQDRAIVISTSKLLANDSDPDGDPISVISVTSDGNPNSGTVSLSGTTITYTPKAGFIGEDTFTYMISDGKGGTATATVTVTMGDKSLFRIIDITKNDTEVTLDGMGVPRGAYFIVQRANTVAGPYSNFGGPFGPVDSEDGSFEFQDLTHPIAPKFYRIRISN
jgi:hypothetical protein